MSYMMMSKSIFHTLNNRGDWKTSTSVAKGKFNNEKIKFKNIFRAEPPIDSAYHFGSRLVIKD